jgi:hypothetical protein
MSDFYAGLISGLTSTFVCNPFDVIRTNIQLNNKIQYNLSYLYRGIHTSIITIPCYWSFYFYFYNKLNDINKTQISFMNGYIASNISSTITCPLWFIKQKNQSQNHIQNNKKSIVMFDFINYYKKYGIRPFYKGLTSTYIINASFLIQMPIYENLKKSGELNKLINNDTLKIFIITAYAKIIASCVFYPIDTIRTIKRDSTLNYFEIIKKLNKNPIKYYSGLKIYLIRSIPYHTTTFCTFEYFKKLLKKK